MKNSVFKFQTKPFAHQREILEKSFQKTAFAFLMEQGTGKSKTAIDTAVNLYLTGEINGVFIVAPSGVDSAWVNEQLPQHVLHDIAYTVHLHKSSTAKTAREINKRKQFLKFVGLKFLVMMPESLLTNAGDAFANEFLHTHSALMIVDESGKLLKNHRAKRTKTLIKLGRLAKYRRILTGTPVTKSPLDIYSQFDFLDKNLLGFTNYYSFKNYFAVETAMSGGGRLFSKIVGYKNLDKLLEIVKPHAARVLKRECLDLPPKIYKKHYYELTNDQLDIYVDLKKNSAAFPTVPAGDAELLEMILINRDAITTNHALTKLLRLQQILSGYVPLDNGSTYTLFTNMDENPRVIALQNALEDIDGKIIIWCRFITEIKSLLKFYADSAVAYYGEMSQGARIDALNEFKTNDKIRYFIANPACAGYGLTITEANTVVYYSNDFNLETRLQSEDRCHRIGQKNRVLYIDMVANGTIDEHIARILTQKMQYSEMLNKI